MIAASHPILSCDEARELEAKLFGGDEAREWEAMQRAGRGIAAAVLRDFGEIGGFPPDGRVLVLVGKGHNGGDALIAAAAVLASAPEARATVVFGFGERSLRPLAQRAWREALGAARGRWTRADQADAWWNGPAYDLCLDGIFGFQFRAPADAKVTALLERANSLRIRLRAAVDLPSAELFRADFTYATGSVKEPLLASGAAGRIRFVDLGFFATEREGRRRVLAREVLKPLAGLRPPRSDKRSYGHLFVVGGSRSYPGAVLMAVRAGLRAGAGLLTAFVPESLVPAFAAQVPEAIWVGWPETPAGGLSLEGEHRLRERIDRASALVLGPGVGREAETLALARSIVTGAPVPVVLDADALQPEIVDAAGEKLIVTPHAGEFARISGGRSLEEFAAQTRATVVLKGPVTRMVGGAEADVVYHSFDGGPVLARGGSGDILAGMIGGLLAQQPGDRLLAAARGVVWHGRAADLLAQAQGPMAVQTTQLLDYLPAALREAR